MDVSPAAPPVDIWPFGATLATPADRLLGCLFFPFPSNQHRNPFRCRFSFWRRAGWVRRQIHVGSRLFLRVHISLFASSKRWAFEVFAVERRTRQAISILLNLVNHTSLLTCPVCFLWNAPKNSTLNIEIMRTRYAKWLSICRWYCKFDNLYVQSGAVIIILFFICRFFACCFCLLVCYHIIWRIKMNI